VLIHAAPHVQVLARTPVIKLVLQHATAPAASAVRRVA
jgi:hypothetical protein